MKLQVLELTKQLLSYFKQELESVNEITLFLCGGSGEEETRLRLALGKKISQISSKYTYSVYYPEDMFTELISSHQLTNLLTLENILANSVHCVVILLHSPGTFTELGAFSNHESLCNKLVIVLDNIYHGNRSFITLGPLRFLKNHTTSKVVYSDIKFENLSKLTKLIADAARDIPRQTTTMDFLANSIASLRFYLALIYVFEPFPKTLLLDILKRLDPDNLGTVSTVSQTVTNYLASRQQISIDRGILSTTKRGIDELLHVYSTKKRQDEIYSFLSDLRLDALNLIMRK